MTWNDPLMWVPDLLVGLAWLAFALVTWRRSKPMAALGLAVAGTAAGVLGLVPLSATEWVACAVVGASAMAVPELHKLWRWRRAQRSRRSAPA